VIALKPGAAGRHKIRRRGALYSSRECQVLVVVRAVRIIRMASSFSWSSLRGMLSRIISGSSGRLKSRVAAFMSSGVVAMLGECRYFVPWAWKVLKYPSLAQISTVRCLHQLRPIFDHRVTVRG